MSGLSICVAIPVENLSLVKEKISEAKKSGAKYVELRLDYLVDIFDTPISIFQEIINQSEIPLIMTLRSSSEGGQNNLNESKRIQYIKEIISLHPAFIDIEIRLPKETLESIHELCKQNSVKIIYSYHDFQKTPNIVDGQTLLYSFIKKAPGFQEENNENVILKTIFTAKSGQDNLVAVQIIRWMLRMNMNIICFCMGEKGIHSRIESLKAGAYLTFASLNTATAPGQIEINELKKYYS